jgi:hypothetical protein
MAIGGKHILVGNATSNPGVLNAWLKANGGYTSGNDLIESVVPNVNPKYISWPSDAMHPKNDLPVTAIQGYLNSCVLPRFSAGTHASRWIYRMCVCARRSPRDRQRHERRALRVSDRLRHGKQRHAVRQRSWL